MIIIPQPPMLSGTTDEQIKQLKRYMNRLSETLSVWLNVDSGTTVATQTVASDSGTVATLDSEVLITYGTFTITYAKAEKNDTTATTVNVTFPTTAKFKAAPVVICSQPFSGFNVVVSASSVTTTGFTATLQAMDSAGSCAVMYAAIGKSN